MRSLVMVFPLPDTSNTEVFAVGERVLLESDEWIVVRSMRDGDGAWVYDLHREQERQVEHRSLRKKVGENEPREPSENHSV
jgi:hypothetical protein